MLMKHASFWKQTVAVLLALVLSVGLLTPALAVGSDTEATEDDTHGITFEKVDNDSVDFELPIKNQAVTDEETPQYADTDTVRVSIVLKDASTLEKGFTSEDISNANRSAVKYRQKLESEQQKLARVISKKALDGEPLDIVWNLTLAANIISANVEYGQIEQIEQIAGVEEVLIETQYEACVVDQTEATDPNMSTSSKMIGSTAAWAAGYTGTGSKIAIVDTGADVDHPSLDPYAYTYAVKDSGITPMDVSDIAAKLEQLNVYKRAVEANKTLSASDLYVNAKIPFGYNYADDDLDITHDNDTEGDHGSHVTGIAAGNRYVPNGDGTYVSALDSADVLTQGVAPDAQVFTMKVFGKSGGAYDSDYMVAIEDAIVLGADSVNLSLGSGNPGFSRNSNATFQSILENIVKSGTVVTMSAGNSGSWFENTTYGYPYAESVSWATNGSPGSYTNSLAVASVDNDGVTGNYIEFNGHKIFYNETTGYTNEPMITIAGEHEFVYVDTPGAAADFAAVKDVLNGKIAICNRGDLSFYQKAENAVANGAIATIIANNTSGVINIDLSDYTKSAPAVSILLSDGQYIKENAEAVTDDAGNVLYYTGKMTVFTKPYSGQYNSDYYTMSDFSSWGIPGSLEMKPEITAPGGNIYSLMDGGSYQNMSGTSMASPQVAGMAAVLAQYIKENGLAEKTGLSDRVLAQSLLMSTAAPIIEDYGEYGTGYYPVLRQGAGLANVGSAISSGSYLLMDENATASYADGKIKAELGDDPDRTGEYSFGFTLYNMEDTPTAFTLSADFFTQDLFANQFNDGSVVVFEDTWTAMLAANVSWIVDGEAVEIADASDMEYCDFNGDGKITTADGQALLDYVTGVRTEINDEEYADFDEDGDIDSYDAYLFFKQLGKSAVEVPANGSIHVTVNVKLSKEQLDYYDEGSDGTGTYVEGYVYATELSSAEGELGTEHSIPVLGYYGSWTDPSMYDIGSYLEYMSGQESRIPYMYAAGKDNALNYQTLTVQYAGDSGLYYFGGNSYDVTEEFYDPDRDSINPDTTTFAKAYFSLIRNAANARVTITDTEGNSYLDKTTEATVPSAFYYENTASWQYAKSNLAISTAPKSAPENAELKVSITMAPEYYVDYSGETAVTDWDALGDGATKTYTAFVDKTAPELSDVYFKESVETGDKVLELVAQDNRYVAAAFLIDYDEQAILSKSAGSPEGAARGEAVTLNLDMADAADVDHLLLQVYDYADNYSTYKINLNKEELNNPVEVTLDKETMTLYRGTTGKLTAEVSPFGIKPDTVTWSSSDEKIATVDAYGIVTAVEKGEAVITATSVKDPTKSASCTVTVQTVDVTIAGALQDAEGKAQLYIWDLANDKTWTPDVALEAPSITSTTLDYLNEVVYAMDGEDPYNLYKVDPDTGKTLETYSTAALGIPMWDMEYSSVFSTAEDPQLASIYNFVLFTPAAPDKQEGYGFNLGLDLYVYGDADYFTALTSLGQTAVDTDKDGVKETVAELFLALDNAGNIWNFSVYQTAEGYSTNFGIMDCNLSNYGLDFAGYDDSMYCSMIPSVENDELVLYLSYFTGDTNEIYRMVLTDDGWDCGLIANFGADVWPATLLVAVNNSDMAEYASKLSAEATMTADAVQVSTDELRQARSKGHTAPANGSLNAVTLKSSPEILPLGDPVETEPAASNVTVSEDEKTVTVKIVPQSEDATTNGLMTVEYDADILTLTGITFAAEYSSHKDEAGKVTLGYVHVAGLPAGTPVATLTFSVDPTKVETNPVITVKQLELNDQKADVTESLTAEFHTETEVRDAKDPTCTEKGYTGDTYCKVCGKLVAKGEEIDALGHTPEVRDAKEPTCTEKGYTGDTYCKVCNELLEKGKDIAALGHDYKNGKCTRCGAKQPDVQTGDESNLALWFTVLTFSAALAAAAVVFMLRKKRSN